jgi:hypothetical protein
MLLDGSGETALAMSRIYARRSPALFRPSAPARALSRLRARALDRALVDGADPAASAQLAAHARRLTSDRSRAALACSLERLAAAQPDPGRRFQVIPFEPAGRANARQLTELAARLRGPSPVYSPGVARLRQLVSDGNGPVYADRTGEWLSFELSRARDLLGG